MTEPPEDQQNAWSRECSRGIKKEVRIIFLTHGVNQRQKTIPETPHVDEDRELKANLYVPHNRVLIELTGENKRNVFCYHNLESGVE